jgi:FSR family fosmidomycin resistance protein-like MFS transporter
MVDSNSRTYWKILVALSLVHFSGDFYSSFINPLFPVFMDRMGLSLAQVGFYLLRSSAFKGF